MKNSTLVEMNSCENLKNMALIICLKAIFSVNTKDFSSFVQIKYHFVILSKNEKLL